MRNGSLGFIPSLSDIGNLTDIPRRITPLLPNSNEMILITSEKQIWHSFREIQEYVKHQNNCSHKDNEDDNISIDQYNLQPQIFTPDKTLNRKKKGGCVCKKTNCLKLYCECFASGRLCTSQCVCCKCYNVETKTDIIQQARGVRKSKTNIGLQRKCNCKKSNCQKKYCECYNAGLSCGPQCNCCQCHNIPTKERISQSQESQNYQNEPCCVITSKINF